MTSNGPINSEEEPRASVLLEARGFSKTFGIVRVLENVNLEVRSGEVRGLIGQNGSGKSTFIKLLTGVYTSDPGGSLRLAGHNVAMHAETLRSAEGLAVMHQDLGLEPSLSVADNFLIGRSGSSLARIRWRREHTRISALLEEYGLSIDSRRPLTELGRSQQAVVAMARAFDRIGEREGVLVLDEPTAALESDSTEALFTAIGSVRARGCGVIFVSHDLGEIRELCDTVSVLRDGVLVADGPIDAFDERDLIRAVVGSDIGELYPSQASSNRQRVALAAQEISGRVVRNLSFELFSGEVLGITGLAGMGHDEVGELIYGVRPMRSGEIRLFGQQFQPSPARALAEGMIFLPADRKALGGDGRATVEENLTLPIARRYFRQGRMHRAAATKDVAEVLRRFDVRPPDPRRLLGELSGGNQQKALLAKWLGLFPAARILLLHEPTQGVDVAARQEIFRIIEKSVEAGCAALYISAEYEDLAHLCDRVVVLRHGRVAAEIGKAELTAAAIASLALASNYDGAGRHRRSVML